MEGHLVHYNEKYGSYKSAAKEKDGLAVVAFFFDTNGNEKNMDFEKIFNGIKTIIDTNITEIDAGNLRIHWFYLKSVILSFKKCTILDCLKWLESYDLDENYFTYRGSLTSPPYTESVTWIVYRDPIKVSKDQVYYFVIILEKYILECLVVFIKGRSFSRTHGN